MFFMFITFIGVRKKLAGSSMPVKLKMGIWGLFEPSQRKRLNQQLQLSKFID